MINAVSRDAVVNKKPEDIKHTLIIKSKLFDLKMKIEPGPQHPLDRHALQ
jgi:hypothetical protein